MDAIAKVTERIVALNTGYSTVLIAVDGQGGAGKTTLVAGVAIKLAAAGLRVDVVHFDDFYLPSSQRPHGQSAEKPIGGDFDWRRLRNDVLIPLRQARPANYARYDWNTDALEERHEITPGALVMVEGVFSSRQELADLYDLRIWVDCSREVRLRRGIARDGEAYRDCWECDWMPSEDHYVAVHRPDKAADIVVSGMAP